MSDRSTRSGASEQGLRRLSRALEGYVERGELAGLVSMVWRHGELVHTDAVGWRDRQARSPIRRDTIFRIASMTKPITAAAALTLVDDGRLRLFDPIDDWLPELALPMVLRDPNGSSEDVVSASRPITLDDLLTNRMGLGWGRSSIGPELFTLTAQPIAAALGLPDAETLAPDAWMRRVGAFPLIADPGTIWRYHTSSDILGVLIARVTGQSLETVLRERLFRPLGMVDTSFTVPPSKRDRLAVLYGPAPDFAVLDHPCDTGWAVEPPFASGGAGLVSTGDDYARFAHMLLGKGQFDGVRVLSRQLVEAMTTDHLTDRQRAEPPFALPLGQNLWAEHGFGYGLRVRTRQSGAGPSVGTLSWPGGLGTAWYADPHKDVVALLLLQSQNLIVAADWRSTIGDDFRTLTARALED
ncbi:serine hydrolase domain-containing protein [Nocardia sp. NPDC023852]|uniref:serine hydrolase domain-containing protein n=1 Tax=Nocardia sp. NPDC023852 TaxID=3154697 RepID=UPI0033C25A5A